MIELSDQKRVHSIEISGIYFTNKSTIDRNTNISVHLALTKDFLSCMKQIYLFIRLSLCISSGHCECFFC